MHFNNKTFAGVRPHKLGHLSHSAGGWHAYRPINMGKPGGSKHRLEWQLDGAGERECIMMHMLYICVCVWINPTWRNWAWDICLITPPVFSAAGDIIQSSSLIYCESLWSYYVYDKPDAIKVTSSVRSCSSETGMEIYERIWFVHVCVYVCVGVKDVPAREIYVCDSNA